MKLTSLCAHKQTAAVNCTLVLWAGLNDIEARPFTHLKHLPSLPGDRSPSQPRTDATSGFSTRDVVRCAADVKWVFRVRFRLGRASPLNIVYHGPEIFIIPVPHRQVIIADNGYPARFTSSITRDSNALHGKRWLHGTVFGHRSFRFDFCCEFEPGSLNVPGRFCSTEDRDQWFFDAGCFGLYGFGCSRMITDLTPWPR